MVRRAPRIALQDKLAPLLVKLRGLVFLFARTAECWRQLLCNGGVVAGVARCGVWIEWQHVPRGIILVAAAAATTTTTTAVVNICERLRATSG